MTAKNYDIDYICGCFGSFEPNFENQIVVNKVLAPVGNQEKFTKEMLKKCFLFYCYLAIEKFTGSEHKWVNSCER